MKTKSGFAVFLLLFPFLLQGQINISGKILDIETNNPVQFATVYINGTTNGTISDTTGHFQLNNIVTPCILVISHVAYTTFTTSLQNKEYPPLEILLEKREVHLQEVSILDSNLREQNLKLFRNDFLGTDVWGRYATIENEEAIFFNKEYTQQQVEIQKEQIPFYIKENKDKFQWSEDSTSYSYNELINYRVITSKPLIVDVPLLGYKLYVDLINFVHEYKTKMNPEECSFLGYFYFQPVVQTTKRDSIRIRKNRIKAYYHSTQHFCKSLYENQLTENGYLLYEIIKDDSTLKAHAKVVNLDTFLIKEDRVAKIIGAQDKIFRISYFEKFNGKPIDLTRRKGKNPFNSILIFQKDTCIIRNDGTIPETNILFGDPIGIKKIGAMLPDNYEPTH